MIASAALVQLVLATTVLAQDGAAKSGQPEAGATGAQTVQGTRPNIVLIMLDDIGFADTSLFGGVARTPRLEELAATGLRYNRFHAVGACSPTRAALLSGRNHHRVGFGEFGAVDLPGYDGRWKKNVAPVAEMLRRSGYSTAAFGKWHNTPYQEITPMGPFDRWPTGLGFEYYYGNMIGKSSQWEPPLWRNTISVPQPERPSAGYHLTTDLVDEATRWINAHDSLKPDAPYFVYFAPGAVHTPHHVPREWSDRYRGSFDDGWDVLRKRIVGEQKRLGVVPRNAELTSRPKEIPAWDRLSDSERRMAERQMESYAGFISHTDEEIGRLIRAVRNGPRAEDTLIIYMVGDNGADPVGGALGDAAVIQDRPEDEMAEAGVAYAQGWAWMASTPFQWMKFAASHLGATRTPLVVSWPARIKDAGGLRSQFSHVVDIAPTLLEVAGVQFPATLDGVTQIPFDGVSLVYSFNDPDASSSHRVQYFEIGGNRAIYRDGWVAAALHLQPALYHSSQSRGGDFAQDPWELYDISKDFSQAQDVAKRYPKRLEELRALFDTEAISNQVYPLGAAFSGQRISSARPAQSSYIYPGDFPGVSIAAAMVPPSGLLPNFERSHRVVADVSISAQGAQGVILAAGGRSGGVSFFVRDGQLVFAANDRGRQHHVVMSSERLPVGDHTLSYEFALDGPGSSQATVKLMVDERVIGSGAVRLSRPSFLDQFDVGQDSAAPVSILYEPPFRFTGVLRTVRVEQAQ
jgi:arylsulfatase